MSEIEKEIIKVKIKQISKEKIELVCKSIKFSIQLISKIFETIQNTNININKFYSNYPNNINSGIKNDINVNELDLLTKIKLFLKITRLIVENTNKEIEEIKTKNLNENFANFSNLNNSIEFFGMIKIYTEKIQTKLYTLSNEIVKNILKIKEINSINKKCENDSNNGSLKA